MIAQRGYFRKEAAQFYLPVILHAGIEISW